MHEKLTKASSDLRLLQKQQESCYRKLMICFLLSPFIYTSDEGKLLVVIILINAVHQCVQINKQVHAQMNRYQTLKQWLEDARCFRQAAYSNNLVQLMSYDYKAFVNQPGPRSGKTALHYATIGKAFESIHYLLKSEADVNSQDFDKETPVHLAIKRVLNGKLEYLPIVEALVSNPAFNPTLENNMKQTAISLCQNDAMQTILSRYDAGALIKRRVIQF